MHQNIIGKNVRITKNVREHINNKINNIKIQADRITEANIICERIHEEYIVNGTITFGKNVFHDKETEKDLYAAIDSMFQKIERKIRKSKEKTIDRSQRAVVDKGVKTKKEKNYSIRSVGIYERPLPEFDALSLFKEYKDPFMAFIPVRAEEYFSNLKICEYPSFLFRTKDDKVYEIYNMEEQDSEYDVWNIEQVEIIDSDKNIYSIGTKEYDIKEFNVNEAVNYLNENTDEKFVVYISSVTEQIECLYKKSDKSFVLIRNDDI